MFSYLLRFVQDIVARVGFHFVYACVQYVRDSIANDQFNLAPLFYLLVPLVISLPLFIIYFIILSAVKMSSTH